MKLTKVHEDFRGYTYILEDENFPFPEITIFFTKAGFARGGCIHRKSDEQFKVLSGEVTTQGIEKGFIPKGTPHYFISLTDSIVMEWGAGKDEQEKDPLYRTTVNTINDTSNLT